jgi:histidyl-tRNA synthetase
MRISEMLRKEGIAVETEVMRRKITKALEDADRRGISHVIIVGERELKEGAVILRDMQKKEQNKVKIEELAKKLKLCECLGL